VLIAVVGHKDVLWFSFYGEEVMPQGMASFFIYLPSSSSP